MFYLSRMIAVTIGVLACILAGSVQANTITSSIFSLGYGYYSSDGSYPNSSWNTTETSGSNTPTTTLDGFSFVPTVSGGADSSTGPTFVGRHLDDGPSFVGWDKSFGASIVGSWSGSTPLDVAPTPNYRTTLEITNISIWAHTDNVTTDNLYFHESTANHTGNSDYIVPIQRWIGGVDTNGNKYAASYNQLVWNPADFEVAGTSSTRTFNLGNLLHPTDSEVMVDGFEVFGKVTLTYDAVPEPGTLALLATGLIGLLAYAWRMRK